MGRYILVFDHGTTGIKTCIMGKDGTFVSRSYADFPQIYPQPGWVEHDPMVLWDLTLTTAQDALNEAGATWGDIHAVGITNQRETSVLWDAETGKPVYNAIVWQCRRSLDLCERLDPDLIHRKTGLVCDPYFSGTKVQWILENVPAARELQKAGRLRFGTVDSWITWKLSAGEAHVTDPSNASRTLMYDIHKREWDSELMALFGVTAEMLPQVGVQAKMAKTNIPITALVGDQQAALYGQGCWKPGSAKATYGTGTFLMLNLGESALTSDRGLLTTLAYDAEGHPCYAIEGSIFVAGQILEWLQKTLGVIQTPEEADALAGALKGNDGVYLVPAFVGLGAPHWRSDVTGQLSGITQATGPAQLARAGLEAMAYQTLEVFEAILGDVELKIELLRVDGGVTQSSFLPQFLADMLKLQVRRTRSPDVTAKGAGLLAGLRSGYWESPKEIHSLPEESETFNPLMPEGQREQNLQGWTEAVSRVL